MGVETLDVIKTLLDLGLSAVLLYFLTVVWKDRQDIVKQKNTRIETKDEELKEVNAKVLDVLSNNTKVMSELKTATEANTKSNETLTKYIYDAIK